MSQYRNGAVQVANKIQRALARDGWCVRHLNVDMHGSVLVALEDYEGRSGEPYADVTITVTYDLLTGDHTESDEYGA